MSRRVNVITSVAIFLLLSFNASAQTLDNKSGTIREDSLTTTSPDRRYLVRFSNARSDGEPSGKLWGTIVVRDLRTQRERIVRVAGGQKGKGTFEAFCLYDDSPAWSPDGKYFAYWDDYCSEEAAVPSGVVCFVHEVHFLSVSEEPNCRETLVLSRYAFDGWAPIRGHTVLEMLEDGKRAKRSPCMKQRQQR